MVTQTSRFRDPLLWGAIALIILLGTGVVIVAYDAHQVAKRVAKKSAQLSLCHEIVTLLEKHRALHSRYPESLHDLPLTYPDGGDSRLVDEMDYKSDGETYDFHVDLESASETERREFRGPEPNHQ